MLGDAVGDSAAGADAGAAACAVLGVLSPAEADMVAAVAGASFAPAFPNALLFARRAAPNLATIRLKQLYLGIDLRHGSGFRLNLHSKRVS